MSAVNRRFSIAPMMDCTDRHDRYFLRLFSPHILLYSEMLTAPAIIHGDRDYLLGFDPAEHPLALQLGGSDPQQLAAAARIGQDYGYDEINLNVGCPSDRVQSGAFGACLMAEPGLVADCVRAMRDATGLPVTVKHRTGIDDQDSWQLLLRFVQLQLDAGVDALIIHARKAWLQGLSPKQNRDIPPLQYDWVYRLKQEFSASEIIINGGIKTLQQCLQHLEHVDGVMLGREPYAHPYLLAEVDRMIFNDPSRPIPNRQQILQAFYPYVEAKLIEGMPLSKVTRHIIGLFHGQPNGRLWRRYLSEHAFRKDAGIEVIEQAASLVL
ncbi:MAG: tRNA dihydrouridine(20/20a) synthase DusA [Gammaproteobacteria bacterium]|nr:tRNA dihydrouridine(20/20a) synthase DusA [Gammaproteobacteria bacterium]